MYKRKKSALLFTACIIITSLIFLLIKEACSSSVQASSFLVDNKNQKLVIILADYIELQDFAENEYLRWFYNNSYSALVSGRQTGKVSSVKAKLTIGASKRLEVTSGLKSAFNYADSADENRSKVMYKDLKYLQYQNRDNDYNSYIGYLGKMLHNNKKKTCVIGNSDTDIIDRSATLLAMDQYGLVDQGDVENTLMTDLMFPGGKRTDYSQLIELYNKHVSSSSLMVIDTGDLARIENQKSDLTAEEYKAHRKETIGRIAALTKAVIDSSQNTSIVFLSTYPSKRNLKAGFKLTPIVIFDKEGAGFLYSNSTKRTGIITTLDIADYLLSTLLVQQNNSVRPIQNPEPLLNTLKLARKLLNISGMRLPVLTWYAIFEIVCATTGLIYTLNINRNKLRYIKMMKTIMLANIVAPAVLLYISIIDIDHKVIYFTIFILSSLAIAGLMSFFIKNSIAQFLAASLFVNISIIVDLFRGSALIKNSLFGYDPIIGARFYGIGNEFAGVFIGSGLLLGGSLLQYFKPFAEEKPKKISLLIAVYIIIQILMMGMPFTGANFGGTIAGVVGYYFFFSAVKKSKIRIRHIALMMVVLILALSAIIAWDLLAPSRISHVGKFITDIKDHGLSVLYTTLARKAAMNLKLIKYTIWTKVLLCIILIITIMFFKPVRLLHSIFRKYRYLTAAWLGISTGSIAGLIANDSGIVMAATAMIFTGYTILYICLEERSASN